MRQNLRRPVLWASLIIVALAVSLAGYVILLPGTIICGVPLEWMTVKRAAIQLEEALNWESKTITLSARGIATEKSFSELGANPDYLVSVKAARRPIWRGSAQAEYPLIIRSNYEELSQLATDLASQYGCAAENARIRFGEGDVVEIVPETTGWSLDFPRFIDLFSFDYGFYSIPDHMNIPAIDTPPPVRAATLAEFLPFEKVAEYRTYYADGNDRAYNIDLCSSLLSEVEIGSGETFSFNGFLGPRTKERGYRKAPTFVGDDVVDDYGGGVCQVSTTLYMAMLKAGFTITERYCHSMPVSYVPMGFDATVSYGYLDLKMTNTTGVPALLRATAQSGELLVEIFSKPVPDLSLEIEAQVLKEMPAEAADEEAEGGDVLRSGYLVETVRKWVRGGQVERVEKLNTSMYPPEKP